MFFFFPSDSLVSPHLIIPKQKKEDIFMRNGCFLFKQWNPLGIHHIFQSTAMMSTNTGHSQNLWTVCGWNEEMWRSWERWYHDGEKLHNHFMIILSKPFFLKLTTVFDHLLIITQHASLTRRYQSAYPWCFWGCLSAIERYQVANLLISTTDMPKRLQE